MDFIKAFFIVSVFASLCVIVIYAFDSNALKTRKEKVIDSIVFVIAFIYLSLSIGFLVLK